MSIYNCDGKGRCLEEKEDKNTLVKNRLFMCKYNCQPSPCANHSVCGNLVPIYILRSNKGLCQHCLYCFGHLVFSEGSTDPNGCPICFEIKLSVKQPKCEHKVCVDCFKRCRDPPYWKDPKPVFPYSSRIHNKYICTSENPKWLKDPLIVKYQEEIEKWYLEREKRDEEESYLRTCPICRNGEA